MVKRDRNINPAPKHHNPIIIPACITGQAKATLRYLIEQYRRFESDIKISTAPIFPAIFLRRLFPFDASKLFKPDIPPDMRNILMRDFIYYPPKVAYSYEIFAVYNEIEVNHVVILSPYIEFLSQDEEFYPMKYIDNAGESHTDIRLNEYGGIVYCSELQKHTTEMAEKWLNDIADEQCLEAKKIFAENI